MNHPGIVEPYILAFALTRAQDKKVNLITGFLYEDEIAGPLWMTAGHCVGEFPELAGTQDVQSSRWYYSGPDGFVSLRSSPRGWQALWACDEDTHTDVGIVRVPEDQYSVMRTRPRHKAFDANSLPGPLPPEGTERSALHICGFSAAKTIKDPIVEDGEVIGFDLVSQSFFIPVDNPEPANWIYGDPVAGPDLPLGFDLDGFSGAAAYVIEGSPTRERVVLMGVVSGWFPGLQKVRITYARVIPHLVAEFVEKYGPQDGGQLAQGK